MRSEVVQRILDSCPEDVDVFVRLYADLLVLISQHIGKLTEEERESKPMVKSFIAGDFNYDLRSIAKLQVELNTVLIIIPNDK